MGDTIAKSIAANIHTAHNMMLTVTEELTDEQLAHQPGPYAPPIGWHLWHVARWADRLQASFADNQTTARERSVLISDLWVTEDHAASWGLDPDTLGVLEAGTGMDHALAASIPSVGKSTLVDYARQAFSLVEQKIAAWDSDKLTEPRKSIKAFRVEDDIVAEAPGGDTTVGVDLLFHIAHTNRHLGMVEGLRGTMFDMEGTGSI